MGWLLALVLLPGTVHARPIVPMAVVNDEVITNIDVDERMALARKFAGLPDIPAVQKRLRTQMLQRLVNEVLQRAIMEERRIKITDAQLAEAVEGFSRQQGKSVPEMQAELAAEGISMDALKEQMRVEISWSKLMLQQLKPRITVSDTEIDTAIEAFSGDRGFREFQISEVVLPVGDSEAEADTAGLAQDLAKAIREGKDFEQLAAQFPSISAIISSQYNKRQWITGEQMEPKQLELIAEMNAGDVTPPIRTAEGYRIIKLHDSRAMMGSNEDDTEISLRQIILPLTDAPSDEEVQERLAEANRLRLGIYGCVDFMEKASRIEDAKANDMGRLQLRHLQGQVRGMVRDMGVSQISEPFRTPAGIHLLMVCERIDAQSTLVHREKVKEVLVRRKLGLETLRLMRDARREAFIDIRSEEAPTAESGGNAG